jgi:hypothetical protein
VLFLWHFLWFVIASGSFEGQRVELEVEIGASDIWRFRSENDDQRSVHRTFEYGKADAAQMTSSSIVR